jgi:hypothetical protein
LIVSPPVPPLRQEQNPRASELEQLEQSQLDAQAAHMRAIADHTRNPDCDVFERCREAIPSISELHPGDFARLNRACERAKTESCREAERALDLARADNLAAESKLAAARNRIQIAGKIAKDDPTARKQPSTNDLIEREATDTLNQIFHAMLAYYARAEKLPAPVALTPVTVPCAPRAWSESELLIWRRAFGFSPTVALRNAYEVRDAAEFNLNDGTQLLLRAHVDRDCDGEDGTIELAVGVKDGHLVHAKGFYFDKDEE